MHTRTKSQGGGMGGSQRSTPVVQQNADINTHLNRVLKLIKTREETLKGNKTANQTTPKSDKSRNAIAAKSRNNLKRSLTSVTAERETPAPNENIRRKSHERMSRLRIVKSIHSSVIQVNVNKGKEDFSDENLGSGGPLSSESPLDASILQPLGFISWQQQRNFVPEPNELVLQGQPKPQITRLSLENKRSKTTKAVEARENGCQTTPQDQQEALMKVVHTCSCSAIDDKSQLQANSKTEETEDRIIEAASSSQALENLNSTVQRSQEFIIENNSPRGKGTTVKVITTKLRSSTKQVSSGQKLNLPNKIQFRESESSVHNSSTDQKYQQWENGRKHDFKMSLLNSSQYKANERFMIGHASQKRDKEAFNSTSRSNFMKPSSQRKWQQLASAGSSNVRSEATTSQDGGFNQSTQNCLSQSGEARHTAIRVNQRRTRALLQSQQQERERVTPMDVFSWCPPESMMSPESRLETDHRMLFSQSNKRARHAFIDNPGKPVSNKELAKNLLRQSQQNRTQQFFNVRNPVSVDFLNNFNKERAESRELQQQQASTVGSNHHDDGQREKNEMSQSKHILMKESILSDPEAPNDQDEEDLTLYGQIQQTPHSGREHQSKDPRDFESSDVLPLGMTPQQVQRTTRSSMQVYRNQNRSASTVKGAGTGQGTASNNDATRVFKVEKRILNQLLKDLDEKEYKCYKRHCKESQIIYNDKEANLFNLADHPEWKELQLDLQAVYTEVLEDFNFQVVAKNYFVRSELPEKHNVSTSQVIQRNHKSDFLSTCINRVKNMFKQQVRLSQESIRQMGILKERIVTLQEENDFLRRSQKSLKDAQTVVDEMVNNYFRTGKFNEIKSDRIKEAEHFLNSEPLSKIIDEEVYQTISKLEYSEVLKKLQDIVIAMQMPQKQNEGVKFDMSDHVFDGDFVTKIRLLFSNKLKILQYDSALRGLSLVYKDTKFADAETQVTENDVDKDLLDEIAFYKQEVLRLQGEVNTMKLKVMQNEKFTQRALKDKNDSKASTVALEMSLKETQQALAKANGYAGSLKAMYDRSRHETEMSKTQLSKMRVIAEKREKYERVQEKMIEKLMTVNTRQKHLIEEMNDLIDELADNAADAGILDPEIEHRIESVKHMKERIDAQGAQLNKSMDDYKRKELSRGASIALAGEQKRGKKSLNAAQTEMLDGDEEIVDFEKMKRKASSTSPEKKKQLGKKSMPMGKQTGDKTKRLSTVDQKSLDTTSKRSGSLKPPTSSKKKTGKKVKINEAKNKVMKGKMGSPSDKASNKQSNLSGADEDDLGGDSYKDGENDDLVEDSSSLNFSNDGDSAFASVDNKQLQSSKSGRNKTEGSVRQSSSRQYTDRNMRASVGPEKFRSQRESKIKTQQSERRNKFTNSFDKDTQGIGRFGTQRKMRFGKLKSGNNTLGGEDDDIGSGGDELPSKFGGANIVINRNITITNGSVNAATSTRETNMQTDTEKFFIYIFDYLAELERKISKKEITLEEILQRGREAVFETADEAKRIAMQQWAYQSPQKKQMTFTINELKECLLRLKSLGQLGGDVFFAGLARTMIYKPVIPQSFYFGQAVLKREVDETNAKNVQAEMDKLQKMTRQQTSVGGGCGLVKDHSSPSKGQAAAERISLTVGTGLANQTFNEITTATIKQNGSTVSFGGGHNNDDLSPVAAHRMSPDRRSPTKRN